MKRGQKHFIVQDHTEPEAASAHRDEVSSEPGVVLDDLVGSHLAALDGDLGVVDVGVLGGGVVSPDDDVFHVVGGNAATHRHLQVRDGNTVELSLTTGQQLF